MTRVACTGPHHNAHEYARLGAECLRVTGCRPLWWIPERRELWSGDDAPPVLAELVGPPLEWGSWDRVPNAALRVALFYVLTVKGIGHDAV